MRPGARKLSIALLCAGVFSLLSGCNPLYVTRTAWQHAQLLLARKPIEQVIQDPHTKAEDKAKLQLALAAREYAIRIGLKPGGAFTTYAFLDREAVSWIVAASRRDAFELYQWWFPIIGHVPYKGYFEKEDALAEEQRLLAEGFETRVRGAEAFSTLGWFNDPLLSTSLKNHPTYLANTVIHESLHSTLWVKDQVAFNETLAHFTGARAAIDFFAERLAACDSADLACRAAENKNLQIAEVSLARDFALSDTLEELYQALNALYQSPATLESKLQERSAIFNRISAAWHAKYGQAGILREVNNAEILLVRLYLSDLKKFDHAFQLCNRNWRCFFEHMIAIRDKTGENPALDPFALLAAGGQSGPS